MEETSERTLPEEPPASPDPSAAAEPTHSDGHAAPEAPVNVGAAVEALAHEHTANGGAGHADAAAPAGAEGGEGGGDHAVHDGHDGHDGPDEGDDEAEGEAAAEGGAPGKTPGKRKRRRRRKRKDGSTSAGDVVAAEGGAEGVPKPADAAKKKEPSHAPFAHRFSGAAGNKRHAFAVGEVVAGRVQRVDHGVITIDLFGKATAMADEYEPREIPPLPEPPVNVELAVEASAETAAQPDMAEARETETSAASGSTAEAEASVDPNASDVGSMVAAVERELSDLDVRAPAEAPTSAGYVATAAPADATEGVEALAPPEEPVASFEAAAAEEPNAVAEEPTHAAEHVSDAVTSVGEHEAHSAADVHDALDDDGEEEVEPTAAPELPREKPEPPAIGQVFKGRVGAVSESGHIALLNRIIDAKAVREQLAQYREQHKRVHGMVYGFNRGGFDVLVEGLRAFCPASAMSLEDIADPLEFVGQKLEFLLPTSKAGSKDIIVSRRSILERLQRRKTKEFLRSLTPGQRFKGKVTAVRDFGLFVDIGGVEGLVHQSELSYAFGVKPSSVAKVGDEIDVQVLRVGGEPKKEKESGKKDRLTRVSLSVKALLPDPWDEFAQALAEGAVHKGKVVRATEFGAFIELVPEIEGLLHITELGRDLKHANQAVHEGDEIYVAVERVDRRARRISLSKLSQAEIHEFEAGGLVRDESVRNLRQGNTVKLKVERIEPRCVFARVTGTIGKRGRAFIPSSETGTERGTDLRKRFPIGSEVEAKIIGIDRDGSLKCSIKAMQIDEERQAVKNYRREAAKQGFGTFGDLLRAKLGEAQK